MGEGDRDSRSVGSFYNWGADFTSYLVGKQGPQSYNFKELNSSNNLSKQNMDSPWSLQKGATVLDTLISAQGDPCWTFDLQNCKINVLL